MKIECKLKRDGGTHVTIGTTNYHFESQDDGAHVADVGVDAHVDRLLSIPEAYRMYRPGQPAAAIEAPVPPPAKPVAAPAKSLGFPDTFTIGGVVHTLADVTEMAIATSGLGRDNWDDLEDHERGSKIEAELDKLQDAADAVIPPAPELDRDELVKLHVAKFGSKPHHKWDAAKIKATLDKAE